MKKLTIASWTILLVLSLVSCGGKGNLNEKDKLLQGKSWVFDDAASRKAILTKTGNITGIKNLKDIEFKGDVGKMVQYLSHKSLIFFSDKKTGKAAYQLQSGKGLLASKELGWIKWNQDLTEMSMQRGETVKTYLIISISDNTLIMQKKDGYTKTAEIWRR